MKLPLRSPVLTLLPLLLNSCVDSSSVVYQAQVLQHAQTPLKSVPDLTGAGGTLCAVQCRIAAGCVQFARDPTTGLCRLWPLHSADNPLTDHTEPLYQAVSQSDTIAATTTAAAAAAAAATTSTTTTAIDEPAARTARHPGKGSGKNN